MILVTSLSKIIAVPLKCGQVSDMLCQESVDQHGRGGGWWCVPSLGLGLKPLLTLP
jgi:hypothetical protein